MANDLIQVYLEDRLSCLQKRSKPIKHRNLNWTASKTALIELIYALYSQGVFENANADVKHIAKYFESVFNIELGDFYHTFMEIKSRKINRTKFIDNLKLSLVRKIEENEK